MASAKTKVITSAILEFLYDTSNGSPYSINSLYTHVRRLRPMPYKQYYNMLYKLKLRGAIKISKQDQEVVASLTPHGLLEVLLIKAHAKRKNQEQWDGKWRMVIFDIPERNRDRRNLLRDLLTENGFYRLQESVFVHPYSLQRAVIDYLKATNLIRYIRFARMEEIDDDEDICKAFNLNKFSRK